MPKDSDVKNKEHHDKVLAEYKATDRTNQLEKFLRGLQALAIKEGYNLEVSSDIEPPRAGAAVVVHMMLLTNLNEEDAATALEQLD